MALVQQLEDRRSCVDGVAQIYDTELMEIRNELIKQSQALIIRDRGVIGEKAKEILWRKGYYDYITVIKQAHQSKSDSFFSNKAKIESFILDAIAVYKKLLLDIEQYFDMDLRYTLNSELFDNWSIGNGVNGYHETGKSSDEPIRDKSQLIDLIHSFLLTLGDFHRYLFEFRMNNITQETVARFYFEAFKLNPRMGVAHNQLGNLFTGRNYNLDSIYHYIYSLTCRKPFVLGEKNVVRLFQNNAEYLSTSTNSTTDAGLKGFIQQFILIVDIFYYDKDVTNFNNLCHSMLVDFRALINSQRQKFTQNTLYKVVAILFFCLHKLKKLTSPKVFNLNALLVAICSELIDVCILSLEQYIDRCSDQNMRFRENYMKKLESYDMDIRRRKEIRNGDFLKKENGVKKGDEEGRLFKCSTSSSDPTQSINKEQNGHCNTKDSADGRTTSSLAKTRKKTKRQRRRRRGSDPDSEESNDDADYSGFSDSDSSNDSDATFDTDYSTDDEEYESKKNLEKDMINTKTNDNIAIGPAKSDSNNESEEQADTDNEDVIVEEECLIVRNGSSDNHLIESLNHLNISNLNFVNDDIDDNEDVIIEGEDLIYNNKDKLNEHQLMEPMKCESISTAAGTQSPVEQFDRNNEMKMKNRRKYLKTDPNIILNYGKDSLALHVLKLFFDWFRINNDLLIGCYLTNPEFIDKIMTLLNYLNIDVFTRKIFFDLSLIEDNDLRDNLDHLFEIRNTVPVNEDILLKSFDMFETIQKTIDWESPIKLNLTSSEDNFLRINKLADFGFYVCKMKKFQYTFCNRSRRFISRDARDEKNKRRNRKRGEGRNRRNRNRNRREFPKRGPPAERQVNKSNNEVSSQWNGNEEPKVLLKNGYLKTRKAAKSESETNEREQNEKNAGLTKFELMGKLWLENEVKTLESKVID